MLLDLSAAFDTVDHTILSNRVSKAGIQGGALKWISFLRNRTQAVQTIQFTAHKRYITCGVPQGSSLSPHLFNIYLLPLIKQLTAKNIQIFNYADDLQLVFPMDNSEASIGVFQDTMSYISQWMDSNQLKLNPGKTELVLMGKAQVNWGPHYWPCELGLPPTPVESAKILGITLSQDLTLKKQVGSVISNCFFQMRKIKKIGGLMTQEVRIQAFIALVLSRLDYANGVYLGLPIGLQRRLQTVQNQAARLAYNLPRRQSISSTLRKLHWLPVQERCNFKIGCLVFKALQGQGPRFISDLVTMYVPARYRRSANKFRLVTPKFRGKRMGGSRFTTLAPQLWNLIPINIRASENLTLFRKRLKTWLFSRAYE